MSDFNQIISEQMKTMEQLLYLQSEIERCQELETQLVELQEEAELESLKNEIADMKNELRKIQKVFESQTDEVIRTYQESKIFA
ncbi:YgaB family protein [Heyndrickxia camelliae]|uniref:YgaB-like protein n=1 Tax=Heyndrickxia camelliae TaxID=1707093 RepID=A0A2N3LJ09_9BACI|nr:YgaB family protein [Heyndrickxia camelliae]PKR84523.1 hypothetical protein CWO92_14155 [Heyndrickxia camelliae]